ncbi:cytidine monophosphate-N-acetylneuraminic acid hydroxylase-like [Amphiura filiformis]|uniref:cytidine monophosphate-N-acetylneuraminic acid hydroxylase-like n=1 Tax=Amphiura filiformis TaxID=82378 RepID=UPI003B21D845
MVEQYHVELLTLSHEETTNLKDGVNFITKSENEKYVVFKNPDDGELKACRNKCKHQGGTFIKDIEEEPESCVMKCTKHGWKLDAKTMRYVNPPDSFIQEQLVAEIDDKQQLSLVELRPPQPWQYNSRVPQPLQEGEVKFTYLTHACMEINFNGTIMFTDPWLTGPAFARGWWLLHEPPADWLDRLEKADFIYISHLHSDHLSYPTLELLTKRNPNIPIYVGDTAMPVFVKLKDSGVILNNINVLRFGLWHEINEDLRFMIMMDGVHPDMDTCLLVDYKGHLILNTVDCTNPNGGRLPHGVDIMLSDFAGGASGFPMTFSGGKYTETWKKQFIKRERNKLLYYKTQVIRDVAPKVYCPFAGYFVEAHPSDKYIKTTNTKNDPAALNQMISKYSPEIRTWTPQPGAVLDLQKVIQGDEYFITPPPPGTKVFKESWNFEKYLDEINSTVDEEIFAYPEWISVYYNWCGFHSYNLVIRMIETDDNFDAIEGGYDFLVDFEGTTPIYPTERPARVHNYLEMKNRIGVHRQTVLHGMFWDNLYIGFNNRISREPDTFHYRFWNHMQILLPRDPPDWKKFLEEKKSTEAPRKDVWKPDRALIPGKSITANTSSDSDKTRDSSSLPSHSTCPSIMQNLKWIVPAAGAAALAIGIAIWILE